MYGLESYHGMWESLQPAWNVLGGLRRANRKTWREAAYVNQLVAAGRPVKLGTERRGITREIAYE